MSMAAQVASQAPERIFMIGIVGDFARGRSRLL